MFAFPLLPFFLWSALFGAGLIFVISAWIKNWIGCRRTIVKCLIATVLVTALLVLGEYFHDSMERGEGLFWLGLPSTLPVEAAGAISEKYGEGFWFLACSVLFGFNSFIWISALTVGIRLVVHKSRIGPKR